MIALSIAWFWLVRNPLMWIGAVVVLTVVAMALGRLVERLAARYPDPGTDVLGDVERGPHAALCRGMGDRRG